MLCLLNHNEDRGVLARSNKGEGSLTLEIDEIGLKYTFEAPNTALGDELEKTEHAGTASGVEKCLKMAIGLKNAAVDYQIVAF